MTERERLLEALEASAAEGVRIMEDLEASLVPVQAKTPPAAEPHVQRMIPAAVGHIQKYAPVDLDAGTLRILRDECKRWLASHNKITVEIEEAIGAGRTEAWVLPYWNDTFKEDVDDSEAALATIIAELDRRGLS